MCAISRLSTFHTDRCRLCYNTIQYNKKLIKRRSTKPVRSATKELSVAICTSKKFSFNLCLHDFCESKSAKRTVIIIISEEYFVTFRRLIRRLVDCIERPRYVSQPGQYLHASLICLRLWHTLCKSFWLMDWLVYVWMDWLTRWLVGWLIGADGRPTLLHF